MLSVEDLHAYYAKSHVLQGVSLEIRPGEVVGLLGRNGVGKTTTLKAIMGLRVTEKDERQGLDLSQHNESAYVFASDYDEMVTTPNSEYMPAGAKIHSQNA